MYTYSIFQVGGGFGYDILKDDVIVIHQEFNPDLSGSVAMDEATATEQAVIVMARMV